MISEGGTRNGTLQGHGVHARWHPQGEWPRGGQGHPAEEGSLAASRFMSMNGIGANGPSGFAKAGSRKEL